MVAFAHPESIGMIDLYPRDRNGLIIANSVEVKDAARPHFEAVPLSDPDDGRPAIVILGAGYTGLSAALKLAELRQVRRVPVRIILLDACRIGEGPSGKSAGHICGLQTRPGDLERHCGPSLTARLEAAAKEAPSLVRYRVAQHEIPCNLRDGYIFIRRDGTQALETDASQFSIDPYPYVLGLAFACSKAGVEIHEKTEVVAIRGKADGCEVTIAGGVVVRAACVIAAGGHRMAERISLLHHLRTRTTELRVSTLITDPLPESMLRIVMPLAEGRPHPFANDAANVAYGSIDEQNRMVFGANATALRDPDFATIAGTMYATFPNLADAYHAAVGRPLGWQPLVTAERLCFTRDGLPNVGIIGHRVFYVHALGGHGLAIGTMLGEAVAQKAWGVVSGDPVPNAIFDDFASVPHGWLPPWQPFRRLTASIGLSLEALLRREAAD